jgi:hypothetical protein
MSVIAQNTDADDCVPLAPAPLVELDARDQNGVAVTLLWLRGTDVVIVSVLDSASGEAFELVLHSDENALDVFRHPYAYAAARGLELGQGRHDRTGELVDV